MERRPAESGVICSVGESAAGGSGTSTKRLGKRKGAGAAACLLIATICCGAARAQNAKELVQQAVDTEVAASRNDHSKWLYHETDNKPGNDVVQWVAQTTKGSVTRTIEKNGAPVPLDQQRQQVQGFIHNASLQAQQKKNAKNDERQAESLLKMLPDGFDWEVVDKTDTTTTLRFRPNPDFHPPTSESKVFSAMAGEMVVNNEQHRIASLKGRMIRNVTFGWWGILGKIYAGGTFDVERREIGDGIWQITETHIHIHGRALFFKTITEEEDDVLTEFQRLPDDTTLQQAAKLLMEQPEGNVVTPEKGQG